MVNLCYAEDTKKIYDGLELLQFFSTREWIFKSDKFLALNGLLTEADRKIFPTIDFTFVPLDQYMIRIILGTRQYCLKEDLSSLPRCRQKQKMLVLHLINISPFIK
ncbi:hypothetical protein NQ314_001904 [Rhamnusium bicolor]|uniref:Fatty acyl-CoA reductase C-terminal domain-containing protein n=1 Tax=Rhamnusium bicolor TaxID=1586634 RepID=A0AAV8ZTN6_9CUCU|nr:hypothetical protein NQ314_001904 [Rhamnusium bicolor]